jgi:hypothetical protein
VLLSRWKTAPQAASHEPSGLQIALKSS